MIFISAALVLVAIVLLVAGVVLGKVFLVMWSIVVSVLSAVCLLIGALLRRHELFPGKEGRPAPQEPEAAPAYAGAGPTVPVPAALLPQAAPVVPPKVIPGSPADPGARAGTGGLSADSIVLVIPGRRRFHLRGCRQLLGRQHEELTYEEAREEGFTPCTTCQPEGSGRPVPGLAPGTAPEEPSPDQVGTVAFPRYGGTGGPASGPAEPGGAVSARAGTPSSGTAPTEKEPASGRTAAAGGRPDRVGEAVDDSDAETGPIRRVTDTAADDGGDGPAEEGSAASGTAEPERAERTGTAAGGTVRVIVGTRRFHTHGCPLLKGADDSSVETMPEAAAEAAGFGPCSICHTGP